MAAPKNVPSRAVVTGGAGFLGSHLCEALLDAATEVVCRDTFLTGSPANVAHLLDPLGRNTPLGRAGQPAEVAPAFVFLASEKDASYVSGTVLGVTGGRAVF